MKSRPVAWSGPVSGAAAAVASGLLVGSLVVAFSEPALANPWDFYGFNARAVGLANALTAASDDFTAVYYNPASLAYAEAAGFGFGYTLGRPSLEVSFEQPSAIEPASVEGSDAVTVGALYPITEPNRSFQVAFGIGINLPTGSLLVGEALDPSVPQWSLYATLPRRIVSSLAVGVRPVRWISLGAGVQVLAGVSGQLEYELDPVAGRFVEKSVRFELEPNAAPIVGIDIRPIESFRLGVSYRGAISTDVDLPLDLTLSGIADLEVLTFFRIQYTPHQVSFGASYEHAPWGTRLMVDVTYARWSDAPDPSVQSSLDVDGALVAGTGLADAFDAPAAGQARTVDLGYRDVWLPRVGVEQKIGPVRVRAGYSVRPSPAPVQTGSTNYIDGTAHVFGLGAGVRFRDPWDLLAGPLEIDAAFGAYVLPPRRHAKAAANDPVGSYSASGQIWFGSFSLQYHYETGESAPSPTAGETRGDGD